MFKLLAAIIKELRLLQRDKAALAVMFAMPVLLVVVITSIQHSAFRMVNENKVKLLFCNRDGAESSRRLESALRQIGMFDIKLTDTVTDERLKGIMKQEDAMLSVVVPEGFSSAISQKAKSVTQKALKEFGVQMEAEQNVPVTSQEAVTMFYNPVLQESFRLSVQGALQSAQQFTENREVLQALYEAMSRQQLPDSVEQQILNNRSFIRQVPVTNDGRKNIPNATQHNVPAWTIFAMFFIVVTLSANVVKEKLSGSFIRLKTLPTSYVLVLTSKQLTYLLVTLLQVAVIFSLGIFLFDKIGLPKLVLPSNLFYLFIVSVICGWCAVSYGVLLGVYAHTLEQSIGFGAVSVVILAAVGGIVVPSFAMPDVLKPVMNLSPLYWCMEAYSTLFLEGGNTNQVVRNLIPLLVIIIAMQSAAYAGLKRQHLI